MESSRSDTRSSQLMEENNEQFRDHANLGMDKERLATVTSEMLKLRDSKATISDTK